MAIMLLVMVMMVHHLCTVLYNFQMEEWLALKYKQGGGQ